MNPFMDGFTDELEKLALAKSVGKGAVALGKWVAKSPWRRGLLPAIIGHAGYTGAKAALKGGKQRVIAARPGQPSRAWFINYHRALGLPRRMTKLQRERMSRAFARYRERQ
jgi:hypothetical protein